MFQNVATNLAFTGAEARDMILEPAFDHPLVKAIMTLHEGIKAKQKVAFAARLQKVTVLDTGCGSEPQEADFGVSEKEWNPRGQEMWVKACYKNLEQTYLSWGLANGYERPQLDKAVATINGAEVNLWTTFVLDLMQTAALEDFVRIVWLGNETITQAQLSPTAKVKDYNQVDGFYKQIFAMAGARKYAIVANAGPTYADQELDDNDVPKIFRTLLTKCDPRLRNAPDKIFLITRSVADGWQNYRESNKYSEVSFALEADGTSQVKYRGVPLVEMEFVDRFLNSDFNNGTRVDKPHRVVLTTLSNLAAGVDAEGALQGFESFYDWLKKEMHLRGMYMLDALVMQEYLVAYAN